MGRAMHIDGGGFLAKLNFKDFVIMASLMMAGSYFACLWLCGFINSCPSVLDAKAKAAMVAAIEYQRAEYGSSGVYDKYGYRWHGAPQAAAATTWALGSDDYSWTKGRAAYYLSFDGATTAYTLLWFDDTPPEDLAGMVEQEDPLLFGDLYKSSWWIAVCAWRSCEDVGFLVTRPLADLTYFVSWPVR